MHSPAPACLLRDHVTNALSTLGARMLWSPLACLASRGNSQQPGLNSCPGGSLQAFHSRLFAHLQLTSGHHI